MKSFFSGNRLPVVLQAEKGECGLACLTMIACAFGMKTDLTALRSRFVIGPAGATLNNILDSAQSLNLSARAVRLELEDLQRLKLPAILHWNLSHFVVLKTISSRSVVIHDPAAGIRKYSHSDLSRRFTGIAVEFLPGKDFPPNLPVRVNRLRDLFPLNRSFWMTALQILLLSVMIQAIALVTPFYVQITVDQGLTRNDPDLVLVIALAFLVLAVVKTVITWLRGTVLLFFSNLLGFQMGANVFRHLIRLPARYFENRHTGEIVSRFESINQIRQLVTNDMVTVVVDGLLSLTTLLALFIYSPLLTSISLFLLMLFLAARLMLMPAEKQLRHEVLLSEAGQQSVFLDNLKSVLTTKVYRLETRRTTDWQNHYLSMLNAGVDLGILQNRLATLQVFIFSVDHVATLYFGTRLIYQTEISIGQLIGFVFLKQHFITSVTSMIPKLVEIRLIKLQLERISDITLTEQEDCQAINSIAGKSPVLDVELKKLVYRYPGNRHNTITDISLRINQNDFIAISGASGCGKSTFLKILAGLDSLGSQFMTVNNIPLADFGIAEYRSNVASILHTDQLIMGSIQDNITLHNASDLTVETACNLAEIREEIMQLPMQFNTRVGDLTSTLSAGQVQRILLARAIYHQPRLLLIDEGFSHLNDTLAIRILRRLRELDCSVVLVTHNPVLVQEMDRVLDM